MSTRVRALLIVWAFVSTALYALNPIWLLPTYNAPLWQIGLGIGVAAAVSWVVLGAAIIRVPERRERMWEWFDACLRTLSIGDGILMLAVVLNIVWDEVNGNFGTFNALHAGILVLAGLTMSTLWARAARGLGASWRSVAFLWIVVLNGTFLVVFWSLAWPLGYGPWLTGIGLE